jgi:hypothetical protein
MLSAIAASGAMKKPAEFKTQVLCSSAVTTWTQRCAWRCGKGGQRGRST